MDAAIRWRSQKTIEDGLDICDGCYEAEKETNRLEGKYGEWGELSLMAVVDKQATKLTHYEALLGAGKRWALWHTLYSHGRPDEPEEVELKAALEAQDEQGN